MTVAKLTKLLVDRLEPGQMVWDTGLSGFGVRLQTKAPHYLLRYRRNGRQKFVSIGKHGAPWTVETAKKEALRLLGQIASGIDPQGERDAAKIAEGEIFGAVAERYLTFKRSEVREKTFIEVERHIRNYAAPLHPMMLAQITRRNIATLLGEIGESGAVTRNRFRSSLSAFFSWAIAEGLIEANPVTGTAKVAERGGRERVLSADEIRRLWSALGDDRFSNALRLLVLTGQRRNEIGNLQWSEIVGDSIVLPPHRTKNGREHTIPLSRQALAIIDAIPRSNSTPFLFSDREGLRTWDKRKAALDRKLPLPEWHLHDIRRSVATHMAELGVLPHIIESALNHVSGHKAGVAGIYNRSKLIEPMREALQRWADHIDQITKQK